MADHGEHQSQRHGQQSRLHCIPRPGKQEVQAGVGQDHEQLYGTRKDRRPGGVHHGNWISLPNAQVRQDEGHHGAS
eukprot:1804601-Heterocapsa_arctica.AAC.1